MGQNVEGVWLSNFWSIINNKIRKILKAVIRMKSVVSKDKPIISRVSNWLGLGAIHVAMTFRA